MKNEAVKTRPIVSMRTARDGNQMTGTGLVIDFTEGAFKKKRRFR